MPYSWMADAVLIEHERVLWNNPQDVRSPGYRAWFHIWLCSYSELRRRAGRSPLGGRPPAFLYRPEEQGIIFPKEQG